MLCCQRYQARHVHDEQRASVLLHQIEWRLSTANRSLSLDGLHLGGISEHSGERALSCNVEHSCTLDTPPPQSPVMGTEISMSVRSRLVV